MSAFEQLAGRVQAAIENDRKKIGGMHAGAMARQGLAELRQAASLEGTVAQPPGLGLYGTITPGEVSMARQEASPTESTRDAAPDATEADPVLAAREQAAASATPGREVDRGAGR